MRKLLFLIINCLIGSSFGFSQPTGYGFGKQLLFDNAQVSGTIDLINSPVLISLK